MRKFTYKMTKIPVEIGVYIIYAILAMAGGIARYLQKYIQGEVFNWRILLANVFISAVSGVFLALLGKSMGVSVEMIGMMSGIGGWLGSTGIDFVADIVKARTGPNQPK